MIRKVLHRIAHWLGMNQGFVEVLEDENGQWDIVFRCSGCGEIK